MNTLFDGWAPWHGAIPARTNGAMVSDREGIATPYALFHLQERGVLFVPVRRRASTRAWSSASTRATSTST